MCDRPEQHARRSLLAMFKVSFHTYAYLGSGQNNTRDVRLPVPVPAEFFGGRRVQLIGAGHFVRRGL